LAIIYGKKKAPSEGEARSDSVGEADDIKQLPQAKIGKSEAAKAALAEEKQFPIVGIGASAGGLEAFTKFLEKLPSDTGMAFVFIQHLAPGQESMLTDILSRSTAMHVHKVENDMPVEPNNVYVIPPDVSMTISEYVLKLQPEVSRLHKPIDQFLTSLAQDLKNLAIGVILSGTGSDGTEGLKAIYAEGGITFAQDEDTAKYPGMPHSALSSGTVNFVLSPGNMAKELTRIGKHPYLNHTHLEVVKLKEEEKEEGNLQSILTMLKLAYNVNFSDYKESTINRRISRRLVLHQIDRMEDYVDLLRKDRGELQALFDDLLIGVTSFFREPETFQVMAEKVFPLILKERPAEAAVRVWIPGCATGEEVYSVAIALREYMEKTGVSVPLQIFGTDISDKNIEKARTGIFPENVSENISEQRLKHFFSKVDRRYQISKAIRDICVFAKQDLTRDPPFSNLDLISCRNVLIYLKPKAQKRIIPLFHYALKPSGFLVLGKSESINGFEDLFNVTDKMPLYSKKMAPTKIPLEIELIEPFTKRQNLRKPPQEKPLARLQKEAERILLNKYSPPGVIVNNELDVLVFSGNTAHYLSPAPREASFNLMKMVKEEFRLELQTAVYLARKQKQAITRENIQFRDNGNVREANLEVAPIQIPQSNETFFLVLFEAVTPVSVKAKPKKPKVVEETAADAMIEDLKRELASTKETLQTVIEEQEATNEELRAALEEVQSSNEELQSTNEELETAKEELQSTNEELNTVNEELTRRYKELRRLHDDMTNLFSNIAVAVVVLDPNLKIRLFTPAAERTFNLIPSDVGRPISDISLGVNVPNLDHMLCDVMDSLASKQMQIQDKKGVWYEMRMRPYLTAEKKIDGVVLSFIDVNQIIRNKAEIEQSKNFAETILTTMREPLVVVDEEMKAVMANPAFYETFKIEPQETEHQNIFKIANKQLEIPEFKNAIEKAMSDDDPTINNLVIENDFPSGRKVLNVNISRLSSQLNNNTKMILITLENITEERQMKEEIRKHAQNLEKLVEERTRELKDAERLATIGQTAAMVGHDIRNPLQSIVAATYLIKDDIASAPESQQKKSITENLETIEDQSQYINKIVSDLQDFAKPITPQTIQLDLLDTVKNILSNANIPKNIQVNTKIDGNLPKIKTDPTCVKRILNNLISNSVQAMPNGGKLAIKAFQQDASVSITVEDTGTGIPKDIRTKLFQPLVTTKSKGQGFGLAVCKRLVEALHGTITYESEEGNGTKFTVKIPIKK
jgi:two-component system CheB/CheR fusion protein